MLELVFYNKRKECNKFFLTLQALQVRIFFFIKCDIQGFDMEFQWFNVLPWQAMNLRVEVFVLEQGFLQEFDELDEKSLHLLGFEDNKAVLTARMYKDDFGYAHLGRIAVAKSVRQKKYGLKLLDEMERKAKELGFTRMELGGQWQAKIFYEKAGFCAYGEIFMDENTEHIMFYKDIK